MKKPVVFRSISVFEDINFMPSPENGEPRLIMSQPVINFIVPFIPTQLSFNIASFVSHFTPNERYDLEITITNNNTSEVVQKMPWIIQAEEVDTASQVVTPVAYYISNIKNMIVKTEGIYTVEIRSEGKVIGDYFFEVFSRERLIANGVH